LTKSVASRGARADKSGSAGRLWAQIRAPRPTHPHGDFHLAVFYTLLVGISGGTDRLRSPPAPRSVPQALRCASSACLCESLFIPRVCRRPLMFKPHVTPLLHAFSLQHHIREITLKTPSPTGQLSKRVGAAALSEPAASWQSAPAACRELGVRALRQKGHNIKQINK